MNPRSLVALAPVVALLAACGGEDTELADPTTTVAASATTTTAATTTTPSAASTTMATSAATAPTTTATTTSPPTPETTLAPTDPGTTAPVATDPASTPPPPPPATDPSAWLLTLDDLGAEWSEAPADTYYAGGQGEGAAACNHLGPQVPETDLVVAFQMGGDDSGALLNESIHRFGDEAAATAFYAAQLEAFRTCGDPAPYEVVEHPEIGDAFLVGLDFFGITRFRSGIVRKADIVAIVTTISSPDLDPLAPELLSRAAGKITI